MDVKALFGKIQVVKKVASVEAGKRNEFEIVSDDSEILEVPFFPEGTKPAVVSVQMEYTRQIKSFEPLKVSVFVSMPCHATESEVNKTYDNVAALVSAKMADIKRSLSEKTDK